MSRLRRDGVVDFEDAALLVRGFEADWHAGDTFVVVAVDAVVVERAAQLVVRHDLRTLDAIQIVSALVAAGHAPTITTMLAFDRRVRAAAATEGLAVRPA